MISFDILIIFIFIQSALVFMIKTYFFDDNCRPNVQKQLISKRLYRPEYFFSDSLKLSAKMTDLLRKQLPAIKTFLLSNKTHPTERPIPISKIAM